MPIKIDLDIPDIGAEPQAPIKRGDIWHSTMTAERDILKEVVEKFESITLDFGSEKIMLSRRMRLYRCKRQLLANGNRYIERIAFEHEGSSITIKIAESLDQYRRRPA